MLQIVYISTALQRIGQDELAIILATSRRNNRIAGLTGLLLSGGKRFLQALEGPEESVNATFARIKCDPRHIAVVELGRKTIDERCFGDWAMAHQPGGSAGEDESLSATVEALIAPLKDKSLRAEFLGFAAIHARAA